MIYIKDNKINKFGSNKIYLGDKLIYQTVKEPTLEPPTYLKSAFAYDSFAEDSITDVITNTKYNYNLYGYDRFKFKIEDHYNTIYQIGNYISLQTQTTKEPILKDFKSLLIKCNNSLTNTSSIFEYTQKPSLNYEKISIGKSIFEYNGKQTIYISENINVSEIMYIYVDFNGGSEKSKLLFLKQNFDIIYQETMDTFNLSTKKDVGSYNSLFFISLGTNNSSTKPIDFYYQCYCDKFLSIDEIKDIDNYMMKR